MSLPANLTDTPGLHVVSASLVRTVLPNHGKPDTITAAVTQTKNIWPVLDHDGRWIYGTITIWRKEK